MASASGGEVRMLEAGSNVSVAERVNNQSQAALRHVATSRQNRASQRPQAEPNAVDLASTDSENVAGDTASDGRDIDYEVMEDATDIIQRQRRRN